jgi:hypothetical protein
MTYISPFWVVHYGDQPNVTIYYHRAQCLAVLARAAQRADVAAFRFAEPPSLAEQHLNVYAARA